MRNMFTKAVELTLQNKLEHDQERFKRDVSESVENEDKLMSELVNQMEDMDEELIRQIRAGNFLYGSVHVCYLHLWMTNSFMDEVPPSMDDILRMTFSFMDEVTPSMDYIHR